MGTYNQIRRAGGHVRRGEKASGIVIFWSCVDTETVVNENGEQATVAENQAAYIAGWLRHIRDGSAVDVIRAATDIQRAADWLIGV